MSTMSQTMVLTPNNNPPPWTPTPLVLCRPHLLAARPLLVQSHIDRAYPTTAECAPVARDQLLPRITMLSSTTALVWALCLLPTSARSYLRRTPSLMVRGLFVESMRSPRMILARSTDAMLVQEVHTLYPWLYISADLYLFQLSLALIT